MMKTYTELIKLDSYEDRFNYLATHSTLGLPTFGAERYLNQYVYRGTPEWLLARDKAILRDSKNGLVLDMAHPDYPVRGQVVVHHINPITVEDVEEWSPKLFDLDNLVCVSDLTHRAIHYSTFDILPKDYVPRSPNDTCPWKM